MGLLDYTLSEVRLCYKMELLGYQSTPVGVYTLLEVLLSWKMELLDYQSAPAISIPCLRYS